MAALLSLPPTLLPLFTSYDLDSVSFIFLCEQQGQKWLRFPDHLRLGPDKPLRTINLHQVDVIEDT
jgi:hypothetical protein